MWIQIKPYINDIATIASILSLLLSFVVLAWSAFRYVTVRRDELRSNRYDKYHKLIRDISTGTDSLGPLKLVSQRAFIFELRHFPEYSALTKRLLESLLNEWHKNSDRNIDILEAEIQDTMKMLKNKGK